MARDFFANGASLVRVKFGAHFSGSAGTLGVISGSLTVAELGFSLDAIKIIPNFIHKEIYTDDFGPNIPAEIMNNLADVTITMNLIHFERDILLNCIANSMGGAFGIPRLVADGTLQPAGSLMGNGLPLYSSGNFFMGLNILSPVGRIAWLFPSAYLTRNPVEIPLGTEVSIIRCTWRAIPYQTPAPGGTVLGASGAPTVTIPGGEVLSSGVKLWDHGLFLATSGEALLTSGQGLD